MSSSSKILLFAAVLTVGACAASLFRKPPGTTVASSEQPASTFAHRLEGPRVVVGPALSETAPPHVVDTAANRPAAPRASLVSDAGSNGPPDFPEASSIGSFPLSAPPAWPLDEQSGDAPRRAPGGGRLHRVEDGDTLSALAQRYFGDMARAEDIHQTNRDALPPSGALPIGVDLIIPPSTRVPRGVRAEATSTQTPPAPTALWHGLPTAPADPPMDSTTPPMSPFAEPKTWPADPAAPPQSNPVAPGVIRPASEPLP